MGSLVQIQPPRRHSNLLTIVERVAWNCAVIGIAIALGLKAEAFLYQRTAEPPTASDGRARSTSNEVPVASGTPIGRLVIPRLDVDVVVAEGSSDSVLRRAVGRVERSASPGERGNIVLAGHRDTFFRPLAEIRKGDLIVLESGAGEQRYRVEWTRVVDPKDVLALRQSGYPALTLVTCYPFQYVGSAPLRFVVRARGHES
ncbi:MAG: class D sortase [Thermoanaerobaculia bacterium]|jgi:sortase A